MAYEKTLWEARQGVNLHKFTKSEETATTVILENTPDLISVPGTLICPAVMNKMEQGIYDAHEAVALEEQERIQGDEQTLEAAKEYTNQAVLAVNDELSAAVSTHNAASNAHRRGAANGVASLDGNGKVPVGQLPNMGSGFSYGYTPSGYDWENTGATFLEYQVWAIRLRHTMSVDLSATPWGWRTFKTLVTLPSRKSSDGNKIIIDSALYLTVPNLYYAFGRTGIIGSGKQIYKIHPGVTRISQIGHSFGVNANIELCITKPHERFWSGSVKLYISITPPFNSDDVPYDTRELRGIFDLEFDGVLYAFV